MFGDSGYTGVAKRNELKDVDTAFLIAEKPSVIRAMKTKREQRQATLFALSNLWMSRRRLMPAAG